MLNLSKKKDRFTIPLPVKTQHTSNLEIVHRFVWVINLMIDRRPIVPLIVDKAAMDPQFLIVFESINQADWEALLVLSHVYVYTIIYIYICILHLYILTIPWRYAFIVRFWRHFALRGTEAHRVLFIKSVVEQLGFFIAVPRVRCWSLSTKLAGLLVFGE